MPQDENKLVGLYCTNCNELTPQYPQTAGYCCQACYTTNWLSEGSMYQEISTEWIDAFWKNHIKQLDINNIINSIGAGSQSLPQGISIQITFQAPGHLEKSVNVLSHHLRTDPGLWESYKANIAMDFFDAYQEFYNNEQNADIVKPRKLKQDVILNIANDAAENFLTRFTSK